MMEVTIVTIVTSRQPKPVLSSSTNDPNMPGTFVTSVTMRQFDPMFWGDTKNQSMRVEDIPVIYATTLQPEIVT